MKKKFLAALLSICMIASALPIAALAAPDFSDMPQDYSTQALQNAVENGLLSGADGKIMPSESLTRAQMAAVLVRAFGAENEADLSFFQDAIKGAWYYSELSKAVYMGVFKGDGTAVRPNAPITRQEAFVVLARAFALDGGGAASLAQFADQASVAAWAKAGVAAMVETGFVKGDGTNLNPLSEISRKEFAVIMDRMVTTYIQKSGTVTTLPEGSVMISVPNVTLKGVTVKGNLFIGDGVGDGDVTLDGVKVEGTTVVRGGGVNSFVIKGDSSLGTVSIAKVDGHVRVAVEGGAKVEVIEIQDGKDDVIVEGAVDTLEVSAQVPVTLNNATVKQVNVTAPNADITVAKGTTVATVNTAAAATGAKLAVAQGATVTTVNVAGSGTAITGEGKVANANISGDNVQVDTAGTTTKVEEGTSGVTAGGNPVSGGTTTTTPGGSTGSSGGGDYTPPSLPGAIKSVVMENFDYMTYGVTVGWHYNDGTATMENDVALLDRIEVVLKDSSGAVVAKKINKAAGYEAIKTSTQYSTGIGTDYSATEGETYYEADKLEISETPASATVTLVYKNGATVSATTTTPIGGQKPVSYTDASRPNITSVVLENFNYESYGVNVGWHYNEGATTMANDIALLDRIEIVLKDSSGAVVAKKVNKAGAYDTYKTQTQYSTGIGTDYSAVEGADFYETDKLEISETPASATVTLIYKNGATVSATTTTPIGGQKPVSYTDASRPNITSVVLENFNYESYGVNVGWHYNEGTTTMANDIALLDRIEVVLKDSSGGVVAKKVNKAGAYDTYKTQTQYSTGIGTDYSAAAGADFYEADKLEIGETPATATVTLIYKNGATISGTTTNSISGVKPDSYTH